MLEGVALRDEDRARILSLIDQVIDENLGEVDLAHERAMQARNGPDRRAHEIVRKGHTTMVTILTRLRTAVRSGHTKLAPVLSKQTVS
jgi:hypothetical protein